MINSNVRKQILITGEQLVQLNGYNGFSYRDIAERVGVKTSSIHYYFPTKADLVKELVKLQTDTLQDHLDNVIDNSGMGSDGKLSAFFDSIFQITYLYERRMCLGGMLASDVLTLPEIVQYEVRIFFQKIEKWLIKLLAQGVSEQKFFVTQELRKEASLILSILEGALLLSRLYQDEKKLFEAKEAVLLRLIK